MTSMRILLVDDDELLINLLKPILIAHNYIVDTAVDGQEGWELAESLHYDLILLDVMLPRLNGVHFCRRLREQGSQSLIMLLTSRGSSQDKIIGLDAGADDYVVKPVVVPELEARIRALLRRHGTQLSSVLRWGNLRLNPNGCTVSYRDQPLHLTAKEYGLLELFLRNPQRVYSQRVIVELLWSLENEPPGEETVRTHIKRLRQKLKAVGASELIETVYGLGYRLNRAFQTELSANSSTGPADQDEAEDPFAKTDRFSANLLKTSQPNLLKQVAVIEQAVQAILHPDNEDHRHAVVHAAQQASHRLAGCLGMFGLPEGSVIAQRIEAMLPSALPSQAEGLLDQTVALRQLIAGMATHKPVAIASPPPIGPRLLIIHSDQDFVELLVADAASRGMQTAIASTLVAAQSAIQRVRPDIVLLEQSQIDDAIILDTFGQQQLPVLLFTADRVDDPAIASPYRVLPQTTDLDQIWAVVDYILTAHPIPPSPETKTEAKILILDDDSLMLRLLKAALEPWGLQITTLRQSLLIWTKLDTVVPDLLILDVQMPDLDGIELCQQLRSHPQWAWLPIVFVSGQGDRNTLQRAFAAGADDYLQKPVSAPELVIRIINRLERTRVLRQGETVGRTVPS